MSLHKKNCIVKWNIRQKKFNLDNDAICAKHSTCEKYLENAKVISFILDLRLELNHGKPYVRLYKWKRKKETHTKKCGHLWLMEKKKEAKIMVKRNKTIKFIPFASCSLYTFSIQPSLSSVNERASIELYTWKQREEQGVKNHVRITLRI